MTLKRAMLLTGKSLKHREALNRTRNWLSQTILTYLWDSWPSSSQKEEGKEKGTTVNRRAGREGLRLCQIWPRSAQSGKDESKLGNPAHLQTARVPSIKGFGGRQRATTHKGNHSENFSEVLSNFWTFPNKNIYPKDPIVRGGLLTRPRQ